MAKKTLGKVSEVEASAVPSSPLVALTLQEVLQQMGREYRADPQLAVRSQNFIKHLHKYIGTQLEARLTTFARKRGIEVQYEAKVLGSTKPKNVDVAVVDPENGPFVLIGVRSQMSSIGNNVLTYYEGIVGECISLQDRYPMSTHGYVYLHPLTSIKEGHEAKTIDHGRYARMYAAVTGRHGPDYKNQRGIFDQFAYLVVDFEGNPPTLHDEVMQRVVKKLDLSISTFVDRIVATFNDRTLFWDIFEPLNEPASEE